MRFFQSLKLKKRESHIYATNFNYYVQDDESYHKYD